jgi:hypothetical protein
MARPAWLYARRLQPGAAGVLGGLLWAVAGAATGVAVGVLTKAGHGQRPPRECDLRHPGAAAGGRRRLSRGSCGGDHRGRDRHPHRNTGGPERAVRRGSGVGSRGGRPDRPGTAARRPLSEPVWGPVAAKDMVCCRSVRVKKLCDSRAHHASLTWRDVCVIHCAVRTAPFSHASSGPSGIWRNGTERHNAAAA